jgi:hypothetical protein
MEANFFDNEIQQVLLLEPVDLRGHLEALEDVGHVRREGVQIPGTECFELRQPLYRRPQGRQPRTPALQEHVPEELHACPDGLHKFWLGHAGETMTDLYDKVREDLQFRLEWAEKCGIGFELSEFGLSVGPNVPDVPKKEDMEKAACAAYLN